MEAGKPRTLIGRAVLAVVLWAGFHLLGVAIVVALFAVPVVELRLDQFGVSGFLAGVGAVTVAYALRPRFARRPSGKRESLARSEFPALHALVDEVARRCGSRSPSEVLLADVLSAWISAESRWLGFGRTTSVGLGLPLFGILERDELASVLAHELGHEGGGDLALGPWIYRTRLALGRAIGDLEDSAFFLDAPFRAYGHLFVRATASVSRQQELEADSQAARTYGPEPTGRALEKVHRLSALWDVYFGCDLLPAIQLGARVPVFDGFRRFLAETDRRAEVAAYLAEAGERRSAPWDTHPPLADRLAALGGAPAAARSGSCFDLVGGEAALEAAWYARATKGALTSVGWDELGPRVVLPALEKRFEGSGLDAKRLRVSALADALRDPAALWDALTAGSGISILSPATRRREGLALAREGLTLLLAHNGFELQRLPAKGTRLVRGAEVVDPEAVLAESATADQFLSRAAAWGVP